MDISFEKLLSMFVDILIFYIEKLIHNPLNRLQVFCNLCPSALREFNFDAFTSPRIAQYHTNS